MSDDRGTKPPRPGAGASGTPGSIGKALGGDLDFEPDALLDSLMQDDVTHVPRRKDKEPPAESELSAAELESIPPDAPPEEEVLDRETLRPDFLDDEVTVVGNRAMLDEMLAPPRPAPQPPGRARLPAGPDSTAATPPVQRPAAPIPGRPPPQIGALRSPPAVPRPPNPPTAVSARPAVPRPGPARPPPARPPREEMLSQTAISTAPPPPMRSDGDDEDDAPESQRTSLTDDEIAALDELESLSPPSLGPDADTDAPEEQPTSTYTPPPGSIPSPGRPPNVPSSQPASVSFAQNASNMPVRTRALSQPPRMSSQPPRPSQSPRPSQIPRGEPNLPRPGHPEEWTQRAEWIEAEARRIADAPARSRALVIASELWALAGNLEQARRAAQDANTALRSAMAGRQLRWLAAAAADWKAVAGTLEHELRGATLAEARAHAAYLDAEVHRLCLADDAAAGQRLDLVLRADATDPRAHLARLGVELGASARAPTTTLPEELAETPLARAVAESRKLRTGDGAPEGQGAASAFGIARRALTAQDRVRAAAALAEIGKVEGMTEGALWLRASLLASEPATRAEALSLTGELIAGPDQKLARRALAARALELGDAEQLARALETEDDTFSPADRLALHLYTKNDAERVETLAAPLLEGEHAALAAAALAVHGRVTPEAGSGTARTEARLGRAFGRTDPATWLDELEPPMQEYFATHPGAALSRLLRLELDLASRRHADVATALGAWAEVPGDSHSARDRAFLRALVLELGADREAAQASYGDCAKADAGFEVALRAQLATLDPEAAGSALSELASHTPDPTHGALLFLEAAIRGGASDAPRANDWLKSAVALDPTLSIALRLGEQQARAAADAGRLVEWLRLRREVTTDDVEKALDLVREALLTADNHPAEAQMLLETAISAHPGDVGLRELYERLGSGESGAERGAWREAAAEHASDATRTLLEMQAAFEYERAGERASAARLARRAAAAGGELARLTAQRTAAGTPEATRVSEDLLARARSATDPAEQRELYEALSELDRERGDGASVVLWQTAILEQSPEWLPALRKLEQAFAVAGRDESLEPVCSTLARVLTDQEGLAHARLGARLRAKAGAWGAQRELAELGAARNPASIWALRSLAAHARAADEPEKALDAHLRLQALVESPLDKATLALRAAEGSARLGRFEEARTLLETCLDLVPDHVVALTTLSEVLESLRDFGGAARALELMAESSQVDAHRVSAWHQAAVLWLDKVSDIERGRAALEHAIALDPEHEDAMARLQTLLIAQGDRQALALVLGRRLDRATDPEERIALEVQRGKLLAGVGEHAAARSALTAALDANPDHAGALEALADLSSAEGDWTSAEQALIRLVRHTPDPVRQAQIYRKLGELYDTHLPNRERAELAYQEVLKREPDDEPAAHRLVELAGVSGNAERAVELSSALLERAKTPVEKRDRTLHLGLVLEQIAKDKKRADALFERARKDWPQDVAVLRAAVEYHRRSGEQRAAQMLVDRAATDARRALATGRFDPILFEMLGTVADLRGASDAALLADATLSALAGQPFPVHGAGIAVAKPGLDEIVAPDVVTPALRALLQRAGEVLDSAYAFDARAVRAGPFPTERADLLAQAGEVAQAFGIQGLEVLVSPVLGPTILAARSVPPQIVYGTALIERADDATRYFLLIRALKLIQVRAATLARTVPIELGPVVAGFLSTLADYVPEGVNPKRLAEAQKRVKAAIPRPFPSEVSLLALEVVGSLGSRASQLSTALNQWANRTALLAVGAPLTAVRALALASSAELPSEGPDRLRWIARHAEGRDVAIFCVSDACGEARKRLGVEG